MSDRQKAFVPNPVLAGLLGAGPLATAAISLPDGIALGLGASLSAFTLGALVPLLRRNIPERFRAPASLALSASISAVYCLALEAYLPIIEVSLWIYLPLLAVNGFVLHSIRMSTIRDDRGSPAGGGLVAIAKEAIGYFLVACLVGAFREACGLGTLTLPGLGAAPLRFVLAEEPPLRLIAAPAGGFVILGLLAAAYRGALRAGGRRVS